MVDPTDSVLGSHVYLNASGVQGNGLKETYKQLIQKAFWPKYWNAKQTTFYVAAGNLEQPDGGELLAVLGPGDHGSTSRRSSPTTPASIATWPATSAR